MDMRSTTHDDEIDRGRLPGIDRRDEALVDLQSRRARSDAAIASADRGAVAVSDSYTTMTLSLPPSPIGSRAVAADVAGIHAIYSPLQGATVGHLHPVRAT